MKTLQEIKTIALWSIATLVTFTVGLLIFGTWNDEWSGYNQSMETGVSDGVCNIAIIPIVGDITPYAGAYQEGNGDVVPPSTNQDDTLSAIRAAENDPNIRGILARIDSSGGSPVAGETISNGLKRSALPVAALIREVGVSAAYYVATGAKTIIASPFSDVGGIGVTMSYLDNTEKNAKDGLRYVSLTSAQFKDYGNPDKVLTPAERNLIERDLKIYHEQFVKEVSENRGLPIEQVTKLANGASMPGALALQNKLVDVLGDQETARKWFAEKLEISEKEVVFCE